MTYATLPQLTERYGEAMLVQLTDRETPPAGAIDTGVVDRALADTDAMIDGYLAGRYALPLASTPALVADLALTIAIYKLHREVATDMIVRNYDSAVAQLKLIGSGVIRLSVAGAEPASSGSSGVRTNDRQRPLDECSLKGFV